MTLNSGERRVNLYSECVWIAWFHKCVTTSAHICHAFLNHTIRDHDDIN